MREMTLEEIASLLRRAKSIVLTAHENPDGDAIGSTLGLAHALKALGKDVTPLIDDDLPKFLSFLPGYETIKRPEAEITPDVLLVLDTSPDRIGCVLEKVKAKESYNIDHHKTNDGEMMPAHVEATASATSEIVYKLIRLLGVPFSFEIGQCLYTGLATDTGFFRFSNTSAFTLRAAADMVEAGARPSEISEALDEKSYQKLKDLADAINHIEVFAGGRAAGVFLDLEATEHMETTEGIIDSVRVIEGVEIACVLRMKEAELSRISMRSKGADVSAIAVSFGGGGHTRAAGCTLHMPFDEAKKTIEKAIADSLGEKV